MGVGGQHHAAAALPPGKTRYPLYRRLGGPQGRSRQVRKISPPTGIWSPDRPVCSESLYRLSYLGPYLNENVSQKIFANFKYDNIAFYFNNIKCEIKQSYSIDSIFSSLSLKFVSWFNGLDFGLWRLNLGKFQSNPYGISCQRGCAVTRLSPHTPGWPYHQYCTRASYRWEIRVSRNELLKIQVFLGIEALFSVGWFSCFEES